MKNTILQPVKKAVFLFTLLGLTGCAAVPITGRQQLALLPDGQLNQMAMVNYKEVITKTPLSQDADKVAMVKKVGGKIAQAAEQFLRENGQAGAATQYRWEFNLLQDDKIANAFCMPGGKVAVYTGILPMTQNETGLAVVMGHEVAHAIANHGNERMTQAIMTKFGGMALGTVLQDKSAETQKIFMGLYGLGSKLGVMLPYSRLHESEADHIGLILMARAGYDPQTTVGFWSRMKASGGARPPEFLSTHPAPETRIQEIKQFLPEALQYYKP